MQQRKYPDAGRVIEPLSGSIGIATIPKDERGTTLTFINTVRSAALLAGFALAANLAPAQATAWKIDPVHSGIEFKIRHLGVSYVRGTFSNPTGTVMLDEKNIAKSSVEASVNTSTVNTNSEGRDKHLKSPDFFDVEKFPTMTFKSTSVSNAGGKLSMTGDLTMNGVTKPVTLALDGPSAPQKGQRGGMVSGFSATGTIHRTDFNFGAKYSSPMLGDDVQFTIDIEMSKP